MAKALFRPGDRPLVNLGLLLATLCTTFGTFFFVFGGGGSFQDQAVGALTFSLSLLAILGSHEMGHYLLARYHQVDTSLPYFIPLPLLGVGTLGAVIRIRGPIPHRNALVDIGAAGPLAGLAVAIPLLWFGLTRSTVGDAPPMPGPHFPGPGSLWVLMPQLWELLRAKWAGVASAPAGAEPLRASYVFGDSLLMLGLQRLVFGALRPGKEVFIHPMVVAGWFGTLVTMLNLIPIGQLDGGHLTHALLGERARGVGKVMALGMAGLCVFYSAGWLVWLVVTSKVIGFRHPPVTTPEQPLAASRRWICALCLLALILCVMPVPLTQVAMP